MTIKTVDAPCPECDANPVHVLEVLDGQIWLCPACGYSETEETVDIEAQLDALDAAAPEVAAEWRRVLGL